MKVEFRGRVYECTRASDVQRDGMSLELSQIRDELETIVVEVFYSDQTGEMSLSTFEPMVPLEAVEWLIAQAKVRLPPQND